ncbi:2OG-Fe(II) oxygenase family protein [Winogradskyella sp.]|jgi:hypothetical protein|uniref:2OG-Fe(II) oxygenase family protein n=1 Tax=Winogradskyella sp. TaxID=1883156 RepID=UPI0025F27433|nr:2OG-Fe(II) oxygenase family protein [Winogradskyella sp.]MCT4629464.1 2OG-Fe(II) oxygenase family protein [Winogradskyella sp.]
MKEGLSSKASFFKLKNAIAKSSDESIKSAFETFLKQPKTYRLEYLQAHFNCAFDGYSFLGQEDSLNQYSTDLLHSFVLSKFSPVEKYPVEFASFLKSEWDSIVKTITSIEQEVISQLQISGLEDFYNTHIGHMASCNYYPAISKNVNEPLRLSKHVDVSLFTVFVYGSANGFSYEDEFGDIKALKVSDHCVVFPGYLLEYLTKGKIKALPHQVNLQKANQERYSFAFFSIPKPKQQMQFGDMNFSSDAYYKAYLNLF